MNSNTNKRKSNPWILHVKTYAVENNCSYAAALRAAKASYSRTTEVVTEQRSEPRSEAPSGPTETLTEELKPIPEVTRKNKKKRSNCICS